MQLGPAITAWTIRISLLCCLATIFLWLGDRHRSNRVARSIWTIGFVFYVAHVAAAFHYYHSWSHAEAYDHTARETARITGIDWDGGLYVNYAFTIVWLLDVVWWWRGLDRYRHGLRWVPSAVYGLSIFMAVNAAIVFETGLTRWTAVACCGGLVTRWAFRRAGAE